MGNKGKAITPAIQTYFPAEPTKPISPNFGTIQWPKTPTPPHLRKFDIQKVFEIHVLKFHFQLFKSDKNFKNNFIFIN